MTDSGTTTTANELLSTSWFDSAWIPNLTQYNVLEYFSQRTNPFYDRTCNNEVIKMQRADPAQLVNMTGTEYMLLHVQEPILYVIRKVNRQSPTKVTPLANYYILGGIVYQCPDIWSVINSRMLSALHLVHEAFTESISYARYDPSKGYYWEFPNDPSSEKSSQKSSKPKQEEPDNTQRKRVDLLLGDLVKKFPPKAFARKDGEKPVVVGSEKQEKTSRGGEVKDGVGSVGGIKRLGSDNKLPDPKRKRT